MSAARWRLAAKVCVLLIIGGVVLAWLPFVTCVMDVADGMTRELNPLTERELGGLIQTATAGEEAIPATFGGRAELAMPVCRAEHPYSDGAVGWLLAVFGVLGFLFTRNQARLSDDAGGPISIDIDKSRSISRERDLAADASRKLPDALDIGDVDIGLTEKDKQLLEAVGDINHRDQSLMIYLQDATAKPESKDVVVPAHIDGFFCPPGFADKSTLYVDPQHAEATDTLDEIDAVNNPERPFKSLEGALKLARVLIEEEAGTAVMVRLLPGVYHVSVDVPDRCVVVNHRLPSEGSFRTRLKWLTDQSVDSPDAVTLLTPPNAQYAIKFEPGVNQGIFGCHVVGRENIKQAGLIAVNCRSLAIANCAFEGFIGGAIRVQDAGTELAGGAVLIHGCRIHRNESKIGGGLYALRSSVTLVDCIVERNKAATGGAIYGIDLRAPLTISSSRIAYNRARLDETPTIDLAGDSPEAWGEKEGLGGGIFLRNSRLKLIGSECVENGASVAGGGIAMVGCKAILEEGDDGRCRLARNKARVGAAIVAIGTQAAESTLKATSLLAEQNKAVLSGGAVTAIGTVTLQFLRGDFTENEVTGELGVGGALACHLGSEAVIADVEFLDNKSSGSGGALAAVDGRLALKENSRIRGNLARLSGGGVYAVTTSGAAAVALVKQKAIKLPLTLTLEQTKFSNNASTDLGGGMRAGNDEPRATLPLGIKIGDGVVFQLNRTKSQVEHGDDVWVMWAGEVKATDRDRPAKIVLR